MKFHPVISITLGVVTTYVFIFVAGLISRYHINLSGEYSWFIPLFIFGFLLGGYIATGFSKETKIRYSLYEGIILGLLFFIPGLISQIYDMGSTIFAVILFALMGGVGGYIGKSWEKPIQKTMSIFKRFKNEKI